MLEGVVAGALDRHVSNVLPVRLLMVNLRSVTAASGGGDDNRDALSGDTSAGDLDGRVLDRGVDGGVALGDGSHRGRGDALLARGGRGSRPGTVASSGGGDGVGN